MATQPQLEKKETQWEPLDMDRAAADYAVYEKEAQERRARGAVVKAPDGKSVWRIMPPIKGSGIWAHRIWTHSVNNKNLAEIVNMLAALPDEPRRALAKELAVIDISPVNLPDGFVATVCSSKMYDAPCMYCALVSFLFKLGRSSDAFKQATNLANEIKSKDEIFVGAVRMDLKDEMERGPRILQLTVGVYEKLNRILKTATTDEELGGDFTNPMTGFNITIDKVVDKNTKITLPNGKVIDQTKYEATPGRAPSKIKNMEWLKFLHDLKKAREPLDETNLRNILEGAAHPAQPVEPEPAPESRQVAGVAPAATAAAGGDDDWIEDPESPGEYDTRANLRKLGRRV